MKHTSFIFLMLFTIMLSGACQNGVENENPVATTSSEQKTDNPTNEHFIHITPRQFKANHMQWGTAGEHEFASFVRTNGMIGVPPKNRAAVSPVFGGYVQSMNLIEGDYVRRGQVLFTLSNPEYIEWQQRYLQLKEQSAYLKSEYERQKQLYREQISSAKNFLKTQADYKTALAGKKALEKKLRMLGIDPTSLTENNMRSTVSVRAPISGYVSDINITKGEFTGTEKPAMEIWNTNHKHVEIKVFEKDIHKIRKGQKFLFNLPNNPEKTYTGTIFLIGKKIDPVKRYVNVHGHIDREKEAGDLLPEMFTDVRIIYETRRAQALPETAVLDEGDMKFILVKKGEKDGKIILEKIPAKTGKTYEGYVEILSPVLTKKDTVLVKGGFFLLRGDESGHEH